MLFPHVYCYNFLFLFLFIHNNVLTKNKQLLFLSVLILLYVLYITLFFMNQSVNVIIRKLIGLLEKCRGTPRISGQTNIYAENVCD